MWRQWSEEMEVRSPNVQKVGKMGRDTDEEVTLANCTLFRIEEAQFVTFVKRPSFLFL